MCVCVCVYIYIYNNLLINVSCCTRTLYFQKLPSHSTAPALTPEPESTLVLPRY